MDTRNATQEDQFAEDCALLNSEPNDVRSRRGSERDVEPGGGTGTMPCRISLQRSSFRVNRPQDPAESLRDER